MVSMVQFGTRFHDSLFGTRFILFLTVKIVIRFTSISYYSTSGLKFSCDIYWTGGARCRGTSLIVATRGFLTKSILKIGQKFTCAYLRCMRRSCQTLEIGELETLIRLCSEIIYNLIV